MAEELYTKEQKNKTSKVHTRLCQIPKNIIIKKKSCPGLWENCVKDFFFSESHSSLFPVLKLCENSASHIAINHVKKTNT